VHYWIRKQGWGVKLGSLGKVGNKKARKNGAKSAKK
jgi:hypothetical protein